MLTTACHKMLNTTDSPYKTSVRKVTSTNNKNIQAMKNKVNREKTFTVITILCAVIIIGAIGLCIYTAIGHPEDAVYYAIVIAIMAFTILYVYLISPKSIELNDTSLIMHKVAGKIIIPLEDIKEIRPYDQSGLRLFGSGGLFGSIGLFTNNDIGRHYEYVGDFSEAFLVVLNSGKKYVFSCENSDKVIEQVRNNIRN